MTCFILYSCMHGDGDGDGDGGENTLELGDAHALIRSRPLPRGNDHHMQNVQIKTIPLRLSGIEFFYTVIQ
jgi:hypothetical protein